MSRFSVNQTVLLLAVLISVPKVALQPKFNYYDYYSDYNYIEYEIDEDDSESVQDLELSTATTQFFDDNADNYTNSESWSYNAKTERYDIEYTDTNTKINATDLVSAEVKKYIFKTSGSKQAKLTESVCPKDKYCVRKCCSSGRAYDLSRNNCVKTNSQFNLSKILHLFDHSESFTMLYGRIICKPNLGLVREPVSEISTYFSINWDGSLYVINSHALVLKQMYKPDNYCVDLFVAADGTTEMNGLICHAHDLYLNKHYILSGICMIITCFLVSLRVFVFAWVPELQTLHGKILMAYLVSFLVGFLLMSLEHFFMTKHVVEKNICVALTLIVHFSILSAYFWRNVMCYDIWWTFSGFRSMTGRGSSSPTRFRLYSAYAFGAPVVLTVVLTSIEFLDLPSEGVFTPRIRVNCFLSGYARLLYFLGPLMILFVINIIFFTLTAFKIASIKRQNKVVLRTKDSCTQKPDTRRFTLFTKLFASMAFLEINLVLEVIALLHSGIIDILHISDIFNVLVPFIIIVNFLCRRQTWRMINKRYRKMRGLPITSMQSTVRVLNSQASRISHISQSDIDSSTGSIVTHL